jgi:exopolysaccharide biosynthesis predicted pyruvyltransferase EpsI
MMNMHLFAWRCDRVPGVQVRPAFAARERRLLDADAFAHVFEPLVGHRVGYIRSVGNVGDDLIELATAQLLDTFGIRWRLQAPTEPADVDYLLFSGGGNMGSRYANNHAIRGQALALGPPLIILPQSFTDREDRPFAKVFVRERASLTLRPDGILAPDLALGLAWTPPPRPDRDLGILLRRDRERTGRRRLLVRDPVNICRTPAEYLRLAARYRRIVTDRLHFAIAGLHAGREVTLLANDYHKNKSMHETWLADLGCRFAPTLEQALPRFRAAA